MTGIDSEAARHKARRDAASGLAGAQDAGRPPGVKPASAAKGGQAAGGEAARHRAHRASLMGLPLKQQAATQVKNSRSLPVRHIGLRMHWVVSLLSLARQQSVSPGCPCFAQTFFSEPVRFSFSHLQASIAPVACKLAETAINGCVEAL